MDWSNKVVLITGASSGIGRGLALELARRGARIGLLARGVIAQKAAAAVVGGRRSTDPPVVIEPSPRLLEVVREIEQQTHTTGNQTILALPADVCDARNVRAAADRLRREFGRIDVLIANAGVGVTNPGAELDATKLSSVINVNLIGAANSVAAVLPEMVARGSGQLVAISSLAAYRGLPKSAAYCASKAGVSAMFESLRLDLAPRGISVTIIHPGFIRTPLTAGRQARLPWLMEVDNAVNKMVRAIEKQKKSYAFPWQLATIVRAGMLMPNFMYDWIAARNSFRE